MVRSGSVSNVSVDIIVDVSVGTDKTEFSGLTDGIKTGYKNRNFYVAPPKNAPSGGFVMTYTHCRDLMESAGILRPIPFPPSR